MGFSWQLSETGRIYPHVKVEETEVYRGVVKISLPVRGGLGPDPRSVTRAYLSRPI